MVAAVCWSVSTYPLEGTIWGRRRTDTVSQAGMPTFLLPASLAIFSYTDAMCLGAGVVFGRAWAALMKALRGSDNLDIAR